MASNIDKDSFDLDSLLAGTIEDLADIPEFRSFEAGAHKLLFSLARSDKKMKVDGKETDKLEPVINAKLKLIETVELADPSAAPMEAGTETTIRYQMDNEFGQGEFKKVAAVISAHFKLKNNAEVLGVCKDGIECLAVTQVRTSKQKNANGEYPKFTVIAQLEVL